MKLYHGKNEKREPILLDEWLMVKHHVGPPTSKYLEAHRFVLDAKASEYVGTLLRKVPLEILQEHEFARTPFPVTWVEFYHADYWRGLMQYEQDADADTQIGLLYDHNKVWMVCKAAGSKYGEAALTPLIVNLHQRISFQQELRLAETLGTSRLMLRYALLGSINVATDSDWWMSDEATDICRSHRLEWTDDNSFGRLADNSRAKALYLKNGIGHLKMVLTLALLLSRPGRKVLKLNEVSHHRTLWKGKSIVYKAHNQVTIRLAHRDPVVRFTTALATGLHRRRHGVRGHWAQTRRLVARGCGHQWDIITKDRYECASCGAKRWWVKHHARGDATRGFVTKDYPVTT
jgi:hypothetical protein